MIYDGLRDWLVKVGELGELRTLEDVDWNLEMGAIVDVLYREHPPYPPALIFDKIKGHADGYRTLFGHFASPRRIALTLGVTEEFDHVLEFTRMYHERMSRCAPILMEEVRSGPVHEHALEGDEVDLWRFPSPLLHEKDGGRYLGTGHLVITKDPDLEGINAGTYRMMSQDKTSAGIYIGPGKHGYIHKQKYFEKGVAMPVNIVLGCDPLVWFAACSPVPSGISEFDFAGGLRGEPIKVIRGVWAHEPGPRQFTVVAIKQRYPGHVKQAGVIASQCFSGGYQNRFTIVVDDDIDPTRINDVVWALSTRCDPESDIAIQRRCWSSSPDPMIHPDSKVLMNSRAVIDACRPYEWLARFPAVAETSPELRKQVLGKFGRAFFGLR